MHANNRKFMRLYVAQAGVCADCSVPVTPDRLTLHHVPPLREGGNDSSASNVLLCGVCHGQRHAARRCARGIGTRGEAVKGQEGGKA